MMGKKKGARPKFELLGMLLAIAGFIVYLYFGVNYKILNTLIVVLLVAGICLAYVSIAKGSDWLTICAEVLLTIGLMYVVRDSIATFVDWYNGTAMFGGTGRMDLVFWISGLLLAGILMQIMSCFMKEKGKQEG